MTGLLQRPPAGEGADTAAADAPVAAPGRPAPRRTQGVLLASVVLLVVAASASLARVFAGWGFVLPVGGALLVAFVLSWGMRRLGADPLLSLLANVLGWLTFLAAAFLPASAVGGVVPTPATVSQLQTLAVRGVEIIRVTPAPVAPDPSVLALTITAVWAVAHAVDILAFRLHAPVKAVAVALALWSVPLAMAPDPAAAWPGAVGFLGAAALVLLAFTGGDLRRWGVWVPPERSRRARGSSFAPLGVTLAALAIVVGTVVAGVLPGFGEQPWYRMQGAGGSTTLTTNPILDIRQELLQPGNTPLLRVRTERPVYLRLTSLTRYTRDETWTNGGIQGHPVTAGEPLGFETRIDDAAPTTVEVEVTGLAGGVLVPAPYQPVTVERTGLPLHYDRSLSTLTTSASLEEGDSYTVQAAVPSPDPQALAGLLPREAPDRYTELPEIPDVVADTAQRIVDAADATTVFEQALALQNELRTWEYSLDPPAGHSGRAMASFIETKIGYCEQFAGTMAVMLRSLGIPARVGVGYTTGDQIGNSDTYQVTSAHAHAWVEVLFPDAGWIIFEPTPRDDGNVLVPDTQNLAPAQTQRQQARPQQTAPSRPEQDSQTTPPPESQSQSRPEPDPASGGGGGGIAVPSLTWLVAAVLLAVAGLGTGVGVWRWRAARSVPATSAGRVLRARAEIERVGRGLGQPTHPWETDQEYLERLAGRGDDAATLASRAAQARYARALSEDAAVEAEHAADRLKTRLLRGHSPLRRGLLFVRADVLAAADALGSRARRLRLRL